MPYNPSSLFLILVLTSWTIGCGQKAQKEVDEKVDFQSRLEFLAVDRMKGRGTGSLEESIVTQFIANELKTTVKWD
ncbi:MAG: hypothetical protein HRT74_04800 [Flavobacteriales bacterium]|nr:hypothetical protein [Flavobacteriales bacterium]